MISTLVSLPYELARLPLIFVDNALADRLPETSAPRVVLDRALGSADKVAGRITRNRGISARGAERLDRLDKLVTVDKLEQQADERRAKAESTVEQGRQEAAVTRQRGQTKAKSALFEADAIETQAKRKAKIDARETASAKKKAADEQAVKLIETAEQQKMREEAAAEIRRKNAQRRAQAKRDEARRTEESAADAKVEAEHLGELVDAKKQERTTD